MSLLLAACSVMVTAVLEVYPQWTSDFVMVATSGPFQGAFDGNMVYDRLGKRSYQYIPIALPYAPVSYVGTGLEYLNQSIFVRTDGGYLVANNQSMKFSEGTEIGFEDPFYLLRFAHPNGTEVLNNTLTLQYHYSPTKLDHFIFNILPFNSSDEYVIPHCFRANTSAASIPGQPRVTQLYSTYYTNLVVGAQQESVFKELNITDVERPPTCLPKDAPIKEEVFDMFIFHPDGEYNISDQNLADLVGDTVFICQDYNNTAVDDYELISLYSVKVNPNWGQYALCNGYSPPKCTGSEIFHVGREGPYFIGEHAGQCTSHPETGTWWSLPARGRCSSSSSILNGTCTWDIIEKKKTINKTCVLGDHFVSACKEDVRLPFPTASQILKDAFTETDPSKGGCPAV
eukprot:TRINITY_DN3363_c0_g2_i1.p1 TRINITY_DN3363_c0_g2~~TRINITY_DN3363_c0_g2_i1.p1  ORF type:complete len:400 (+),score=43.33 TRINITY_DN3363_c0_g2_i1:131-1330(+)